MAVSPQFLSFPDHDGNHSSPRSLCRRRGPRDRGRSHHRIGASHCAPGQILQAVLLGGRAGRAGIAGGGAIADADDGGTPAEADQQTKRRRIQ